MKTSDTIGKLSEALAKAQGAMRAARKDSTNPHFRSRYADLTSVVDAVREPLAANGIAYVQELERVEHGVAVTTRLMHASGEWIEFGPLAVPLAKADAHGVGSASTYAKRYALSAALGVAADEDDDGNGATGRAGPSASVPEDQPRPAPTMPEGQMADFLAAIEAADSKEALRAVKDRAKSVCTQTGDTIAWARIRKAVEARLGNLQEAA